MESRASFISHFKILKMKKYLLSGGFVLFAMTNIIAQNKSNSASYNVVFDLTSGDTVEHKAVLRWINLISESHPEANIELVVYGNALPVFIKGKSIAGSEITRLAAGKKIAFRACALTMKRYNIDKEQLIQGVEQVPDAIYEIVSRQADGWGYIKVSH